MDVFYNKLEPSEAISGMDVVGGRLDMVSAVSLNWAFQNSNQIRLVNPTTGRWELVKVTTEPTLTNTALDLNGTALAVDKIYDVFAEYSSSTAFTLVASRWASYGAGTSSRVAEYASGTTYAIGDRVTYGGHDWVKQSSAAAGTTPVAGNDWVDNGSIRGGDGALNNRTDYATPVMTGNTAPSGVAFADTEASGTLAAYKAFNQTAIDSSDEWGSADAAYPHWVGYDFGVNSNKVINKFAFKTRNDSSTEANNCHPKQFKLQASNDCTNPVTGDGTWIDLHTTYASTSLSDINYNTWSSYFTFENSTSYRYYRLRVTVAKNANNYCNLAELKLVEAQDDFSGLYRHDGVLVSDSSTTGKSRRWLGIIYTYNNGGTVNFKDDVNYRYVSNFYNRVAKVCEACDTATGGNWTYTGVSRELNNGGMVRAQIIACVSLFTLAVVSVPMSVNTSWAGAGLSKNTTSAYYSNQSAMLAMSSSRMTISRGVSMSIGVGFNFCTLIEVTDTGATLTNNGYQQNTVEFCLPL